MSKIWHVGMAVPDLDKGLAEIGELFDLTWRPGVDGRTAVSRVADDVPA